MFLQPLQKISICTVLVLLIGFTEARHTNQVTNAEHLIGFTEARQTNQITNVEHLIEDIRSRALDLLGKTLIETYHNISNLDECDVNVFNERVNELCQIPPVELLTACHTIRSVEGGGRRLSGRIFMNEESAKEQFERLDYIRFIPPNQGDPMDRKERLGDLMTQLSGQNRLKELKYELPTLITPKPVDRQSEYRTTERPQEKKMRQPEPRRPDAVLIITEH